MLCETIVGQHNELAPRIGRTHGKLLGGTPPSDARDGYAKEAAHPVVRTVERAATTPHVTILHLLPLCSFVTVGTEMTSAELM